LALMGCMSVSTCRQNLLTSHITCTPRKLTVDSRQQLAYLVDL
jgi:hypothetical protein